MDAVLLRVEQLASTAAVSVDTIRYYQSRGLLDPPRREGRFAWYGAEHVARLARIRDLAGRGLSLATIGRLVRGELDAADEALAAALSDAAATEPAAGGATQSATTGDGAELFTVDELSRRSGIPLALLQAVAREGLLVPRRHEGEERFTAADVTIAAAGLKLLEVGLPLPEVMDLARRHHRAMRDVAEQAVSLFDNYVRQPLRDSGASPEDAAEQLVAAFQTLLPATTALVHHHFQRTLLAVALEHIERVGDGSELAAVRTESLRLEQGA